MAKKLLTKNCAILHQFQKRNGFTLVETLVSLAVLGVFFAAVAYIFQIVLVQVGQSRVRSVALALGQSKMEIVRNLPFADVGTTGGIPQGALLPDETITINGLDFRITTSVVFVDDPFDGEAPDDLINTDYKRVRVEITWGGTYPSTEPITLVTNIVPQGVETIAGGGTLYIRVFNSQGIPVSNATIQIDNTAVSPEIHMQTLSNANGLVVLPGAPACITCYKITVTKQTHSTDRTYGSEEVVNPLQPHATVIEGQITQLSFAIDLLSSVVIRSVGSKESGYPTVAFVQFTLRGTKIIGYDAFDDPVYKYSFSTNTGGGTVTIPALEWDTYTLDFTNSAHNLAGSNPVSPFALTPNSNNVAITMVTIPKTNTNLLVVVKDNTGQLQSSASARLTNTSLSYNTTKVTAATGAADFGQVFFNTLTPATYDLLVTLNGYQDATASFNLSGINQQTIFMNLLSP